LLAAGVARKRLFWNTHSLKSPMSLAPGTRWRPTQSGFDRVVDRKLGNQNSQLSGLLRQIAEFVAVLSCSRFAGASVYINLVEHPARMECGLEIAATEFPPSYRRASVMQATLAAVGLLSSIAAWFAGAGFLWVVGGVLLGAVVPFTLIVILPTNKQLLSPVLDRRSAKSERLLARWAMLHTVLEVPSVVRLCCCSST
jgi:Domain of unknown function (DUF1772)